MKKLNLLSLILLLSIFTSAQTWTLIGAQGFSPPVTANSSTAMCIAPNGMLYVAFPDASIGDRISVMKWNGSSWSFLGTQGFSGGSAYDVSITLNSTGTPYVAFGDAANASHTSVMMYTGSTWVYVGPTGFSNGTVNNCTIKFTAADTAYVAYVDASYSGKAVVRKFNGTNWVNVGTPGFTAGGTGQMTMALNNLGQPHVAYQDQANGFALSCMMYNGNTWVHVGPSTFSVGTMQYAHIVFGNPSFSPYPYICYNTGSNPFAPNLQHFDGSNWNYVGGQNLNTNVDYLNNVGLDSYNTPFVIFPDGALTYKASCMVYNGSSWVYAGNTGFSLGQISFPNIVLDGGDNVYAEFYDQSNSNKISVFRLNAITGIENRNSDNTVSIYPNPSTEIVNVKVKEKSELHIFNSLGAEVKKQILVEGGNSVDISSQAKGIYFVEVKNENGVWRSKIMID